MSDDRRDLAEVAQTGNVDIPQLLEHIENQVLGGPRRYTPAEVSERAGMDRDEARSLWRALGFPSVGDDDVVFTDSDVDALRLIGELATDGFADRDLRVAVARLFGQTFSRVASYEGQLLLEQLTERPELLSDHGDFNALIDRVIPLLDQLQSYAWRRQLAAFVARMASQGAEQVTEGPADLAIGFVDMAGFTSLTRKASDTELRSLLDRFENVTTDVVGERGGRIVKTIGDEVLFQADDAAAAAQIALELLEAAEDDQDLPDLRAGIAHGPVLRRLGDVYGSTVNIASRLTTLGKPGWVLVDREMHDALADDERFFLKQRRVESVRGFHHLRSWRLLRARR